jgi:hypothetical protein
MADFVNDDAKRNPEETVGGQVLKEPADPTK